MTGAELIAAERQRQMTEEDWSPEHDDDHDNNELAKAAACYALPHTNRMGTILGTPLIRWLWPWELHWWKPTPRNRIRELVKAGALCAAEIDRLNRIKSKKQEPANAET